MAGRKRTILVLVCGLAVAGMLWGIGFVAQRRGEPSSPPAAAGSDERKVIQPYTDQEVLALLNAVHRDVGATVNQKAVPAIDKYLRPVDPARLNLDHYDRLHDLITNAPVDIKDAWDARLAGLAEAETVDGARAAIWRATLANRSAQTYDDADRLKPPALLQAVRHPRFPDVLKAGKASTVFIESSYLGGEALWTSGLAKELTGLITPDLPWKYVTAVRMFAEKALTAGGGPSEDRSRLRQASLAYMTAVLALPDLPERVRGQVALARDRIAGPAARGELIGRPAPPMKFLWASGKAPLKSLSDLRGKVVVLDFWATWCVPCRAAFPKLKALQERYGDRVVVLGVTSLKDEGKSPAAERIADESREMADFIRHNGMTWQVVFSEQNAFNPDYAVKGLPHVAILDAKGVVRHNGLRIEDADFEAKIDDLLK